MKPEGMVHALEEIHRLLRPSGRLIDVHPFPESYLVKIYREGDILFSGHWHGPEYESEDVRRAEEALAQVLRRRLYILERSADFEFITYGSSVAELRDFMEAADAFDDRPKDDKVLIHEAKMAVQVQEIMEKAGAGAEVAFHERAHIARLRPSGE